MLYRLVDEKTQRWAFYNDSPHYRMRVTAEFPNKKEITTLGSTIQLGAKLTFNRRRPQFSASPIKDCNMESVTGSLLRASGGHLGRTFVTKNTADSVQLKSPEELHLGKEEEEAVVVDLTIDPLTTELFIEGHPRDFVLTYAAEPFQTDMPEYGTIPYKLDGPDRCVIDYDTLYKCYKDKENGLLFRLVDNENERWAFYNDTPEVIFTVKATVTSAVGEAITPGPATKVSRDSKGETVYTLRVSPGETEIFVNGLPKCYQLHFSGEPEGNNAESSAENSVRWPDKNTVDEEVAVPEESIPFRGAGPDRAASRHKEVIPSQFPSKKECLLYKLWDGDGGRWFYYNDSDRESVFVEVRFFSTTPDPLLVTSLGKADMRYVQQSAKNDVSVYFIIASLLVRPQQTEPFVRLRYPSLELPALVHYRTEGEPDGQLSFHHPNELNRLCAKKNFTYDTTFKCFPHVEDTTLVRLVHHIADGKECAPPVEEKAKGAVVDFIPLTPEIENALPINQQIRWAFFNDTKDRCYLISVRLDSRSRVTPLDSSVTVYHERRKKRAVEGEASREHEYCFASLINTHLGGSQSLSMLGSFSEIAQNYTLSSVSKDETIFSATVRPLSLLPFLEGVVTGHFTSIVRVDAAPENNSILFQNGEPVIVETPEEWESYQRTRKAVKPTDNVLKMDYLRFYKLFSSTGNGVVFRVVNDRCKTWSYYNDSPDLRFTVRVAFLHQSRVFPIGNARDVTKKERSSAKDKTAEVPQRRLSGDRRRGSAFNFFEDDETLKKDSSVRIIQVDVLPLSTELFIQAVDVVCFHAYVTPTNSRKK
ncbi:hypothetical protein AGDE_14781 [Angomonas deanei]|uniref:DUF1935 domain-containing protein n=1 Tax=Angomonas deanei TaxID=59799 RepID=A0A7G2CE37_9TRYP|nr:hypothetical protein AGDE_14781 [Angomonas deanei]CAD2216963.1 Domain of unknown function (DUF1935), putative [Angomonas deanei]|eukprot:EPY20233.1 hypothetical protein AGDE_14781 [Angomonas deanei]